MLELRGLLKTRSVVIVKMIRVGKALSYMYNPKIKEYTNLQYKNRYIIFKKSISLNTQAYNSRQNPLYPQSPVQLQWSCDSRPSDKVGGRGSWIRHCFQVKYLNLHCKKEEKERDFLTGQWELPRCG